MNEFKASSRIARQWMNPAKGDALAALREILRAATTGPVDDLEKRVSDLGLKDRAVWQEILHYWPEWVWFTVKSLPARYDVWEERTSTNAPDSLSMKLPDSKPRHLAGRLGH